MHQTSNDLHTCHQQLIADPYHINSPLTQRCGKHFLGAGSEFLPVCKCWRCDSAPRPWSPGRTPPCPGAASWKPSRSGWGSLQKQHHGVGATPQSSAQPILAVPPAQRNLNHRETGASSWAAHGSIPAQPRLKNPKINKPQGSLPKNEIHPTVSASRGCKHSSGPTGTKKKLEIIPVRPGFHVRPSFSLQLRSSVQAQLQKLSSRQLLPVCVSYFNLALKTSSKKFILILF